MTLFAHEAATKAARAVYSISELNRLARESLEGEFPGVSVEGEITGLTKHRSGHWYFSLKDRDAQLRCVMFRGNNSSVRFSPANGDQVTAHGGLTIYEKQGSFQLRAVALEKSGSGELGRAFERLKARLQAEGLFEPAAKKPVGAHYRHIGVVTSRSGAVLRDILSVLRRRFPAIRVTLFPVAVQGDAAAAEIGSAIETANRLRGRLKIEALIVGRGGGSPEDLQAFNEESVARAIFASELPIASAVGHATDFSIADFVADLRAPTPSAAAELMSPSQDEFFDRLRIQLGKLRSRVDQYLGRKRERLQLTGKRLRNPARKLEDHAQTLDEFRQRMARATTAVLVRGQQRIDLLRQGFDHCSPESRISRLRAALNEKPRRLRRSMDSRIERGAALLGELRRSLHSTGPLNTLARGYSITLDESSQVIRSVDDVDKGARIVTRLADGSLRSTVNE